MKKNICLLCCCFLPFLLFSQLPADTLTVAPPPPVHVPTPLENYNALMDSVFSNNRFLNSKSTPVAAAIKERAAGNTDLLFYAILFSVILLAFLRFFYTRYFNSLFQVFFNTSLRQSQLTDQLLQAKLASAFFNLFFIITGGLYVFVLLRYYSATLNDNYLLLIAVCIILLGAIYLVKYFTLKFTGWLTGFKEVANTYLFVIFLINKIIAVLLLPFVILMAFPVANVKLSATVLSFLLIGVMFFLRFLRSYGLLRNKIKVSWFHFLVFIVGVEVLPLLLIYKGVVVLLPKNL